MGLTPSATPLAFPDGWRYPNPSHGDPELPIGQYAHHMCTKCSSVYASARWAHNCCGAFPVPVVPNESIVS